MPLFNIKVRYCIQLNIVYITFFIETKNYMFTSHTTTNRYAYVCIVLACFILANQVFFSILKIGVFFIIIKSSLKILKRIILAYNLIFYYY